MSDNTYNAFGNPTLNYKIKSTAISATLTAQDAFSIYLVTNYDVTITLPTVASVFTGWSAVIKNTSVDTITIANSSLIDGASSLSVPANGSIQVVMTGSTYSLSVPLVNSFTGTHVTAWSGAWTTPQINNVSYVKIGRIVILSIPFLNVTANVADALYMGVALPAFLFPSQIYNIPISVLNSTYTTGLCNITTTGTNITIYGTDAAGNFSSGVNCGFGGCSITYATS